MEFLIFHLKKLKKTPIFLTNNNINIYLFICLFRFVKIVVDRVRTIEGEYNEVMFILAISYQPTSN